MRLSPAEKQLILDRREQARFERAREKKNAEITKLQARIRKLRRPRPKREPRCTCDAQCTDPHCPVLKAGGIAHRDGPCTLD